MRALLDVEAILARRISHTTGIFLETLTLDCIYSQWLSWSSGEYSKVGAYGYLPSFVSHGMGRGEESHSQLTCSNATAWFLSSSSCISLNAQVSTCCQSLSSVRRYPEHVKQTGNSEWCLSRCLRYIQGFSAREMRLSTTTYGTARDIYS
jgi:hypothetical protein